jgi:hypothetical protein
MPKHVSLALLGALFLLSLFPLQAVGQGPLRLQVDVRYYYGRWQWGELAMRPRAGMAGPDVRLELGHWALYTAYLSGEFTAVGAWPLADPFFHSRKNYKLADDREEFELGLEYRPFSWAGVALVYKFVQYDLLADVELNSDQRRYGTGQEQALDEAGGLGLGLRLRLPLGQRLALGSDLFYFPRLRAEAAGAYQYRMLYRSGGLDERWFGRAKVRGFKVRGELTYALSALPISLSVGYFHQLLEEGDPSPLGWLETYLGGQTQDRCWLEDRFEGFTGRMGFSF